MFVFGRALVFKIEKSLFVLVFLVRIFSSCFFCTCGGSFCSLAIAVRVLFADVEGQGDRDVAYDARLASAILPLTKCVMFNWRDSLQVDRILNLLGVMQRAALNIDLGEIITSFLFLFYWVLIQRVVFAVGVHKFLSCG